MTNDIPENDQHITLPPERLDDLDAEDLGVDSASAEIAPEDDEVIQSATESRTMSGNGVGEQTPLTPELLSQILEGAILAASQPLTIARMRELFDEDLAPSREDIQAALEDIQAKCLGRGFELKEVASGWRFQVRENLAPWVNRLWDEKPQKYSRALLETLSLIAYRQPITRGDIEEIRGVAVSSHIMKTLLERDWVKVVGHRDVPGRPSLYATTRQFLDYFNLKSLDELPSLSEIRDLDELNPVLNLGDVEGLGEKDTDAPIADDNADNPTSEPTDDSDELGAVNEIDAVYESAEESAEYAMVELEHQQAKPVIELEEGFVDIEDAFETLDEAPTAYKSIFADSDELAAESNEAPSEDSLDIETPSESDSETTLHDEENHKN